jgi:hypothetical protein
LANTWGGWGYFFLGFGSFKRPSKLWELNVDREVNGVSELPSARRDFFPVIRP